MTSKEGIERVTLKNHPKAHGPSYGGVWGLKSLGSEGPRAVWSVWAW